MPISETGVGHGDYTALKQQHFRTILRAHLAIVAAVQARDRRANSQYVYVDTNAGPGYDPERTPRQGSPRIFLEEVVAAEHQPVVSAFLQERSAVNCERLRAVLRQPDPYDEYDKELAHLWDYFPHSLGLEEDQNGTFHHRSARDWDRVIGEIAIIQGDHNATVGGVLNTLATYRGNQYGLIYADPNGLLPIAVLRALASAAPRLDVLVYAGATGIKRVLGSPTLLESLQSIGRAHIALRKPEGANQWTFALLSDWAPLVGKFSRQGFYALGTREGDALAQRLNWSRRSQVAKVQAPLPFLVTGATPSTSGTRDFWRSEPSFSPALAAIANGADHGHRPSRTTSDTRHGERSTCPRT